MQQYTVRKATADDAHSIIDIFNYFIENSHAAFPEIKADYAAFGMLQGICRGDAFYVISDVIGAVIGFGLLRYHQRLSTFDRAAELTYFILPEHSRKGLGSSLLEKLTQDARAQGIETLLACISSLNEHSLAFHRKHGFIQVARFSRVGRKFGLDFDLVWMQKAVIPQKEAPLPGNTG
jgi:L-amino acid N-acyltransferase YncA